MDLPIRKSTRLKNYDYSQNGAYFITICTYKKNKILSTIVGQGLAPAETKLSQYGIIAEKELLNLSNQYENIIIDKYVIMPNHIHAIILIQNETAGASPCPTLSSIICTFKSLVTQKCHSIKPNLQIWQTSYYDHIIRNKNDYNEIWQYIENNPLKWQLDSLYKED